MIPRYIKYINISEVQMMSIITPFILNKIYDTHEAAGIYTSNRRGWEYIVMRQLHAGSINILDTRYWEESTEEVYNAQQAEMEYGVLQPNISIRRDIINPLSLLTTNTNREDIIDNVRYEWPLLGDNYFAGIDSIPRQAFDNTQEGIVSFQESTELIYNRESINQYIAINLRASKEFLLTDLNIKIKSVRNINRQLFSLGDRIRVVSNIYDLAIHDFQNGVFDIKSIQYYDGIIVNPIIRTYSRLGQSGLYIAIDTHPTLEFRSWVHIDDIEVISNIEDTSLINLSNGKSFINLNNLRILLLEEFNREDVISMIDYLNTQASNTDNYMFINMPEEDYFPDIDLI